MTKTTSDGGYKKIQERMSKSIQNSKKVETIVINERYYIYSNDWTILDAKHAKPVIPKFVLDIVEKIK